MGMLIKNEFYKLKREWFMAFLLLLSLLPILTGGAGAVFNNSTKSLADLFFFFYNLDDFPATNENKDICHGGNLRQIMA